MIVRGINGEPRVFGRIEDKRTSKDRVPLYAPARRTSNDGSEGNPDNGRSGMLAQQSSTMRCAMAARSSSDDPPTSAPRTAAHVQTSMRAESMGCGADGNDATRRLVRIRRDTVARRLIPTLAAAMVCLSACGSSVEDGTTRIASERRPPPIEFDLLESAFQKSTITSTVGERIEVTVQVKQEKHDRYICGIPRVVDPFGNVLQTLSPRQNTAQETQQHYFYDSQYAFFSASDGEYVLKFENRDCLIDLIPATAIVRWAVFPAGD